MKTSAFQRTDASHANFGISTSDSYEYGYSLAGGASVAPGACLACVGRGSGLPAFSNYDVAKGVGINLVENLIFNEGIDKSERTVDVESSVRFSPGFNARSEPDLRLIFLAIGTARNHTPAPTQ